jgi:hypothetical protein
MINLTKDEVKKIQAGGIDWNGQPLKQDGDYGQRTKWWHGITTLDQKRQDVLKLALGYHAANMGEATGKNDGAFVDMLFKPVGLRNLAWCLAFVSHCYTRCNVPWPKYHVSAYQVIQWAKENQKFVTEPMPGDLEVFLYEKVKGEDWKGHGRIVTGYDTITGRTAGVDGNVTNLVRVGFRDPRPDRFYVRPTGFTANHGTLVMPTGLVDLDGLADR